jgi:hypothetical protein
MKPIFFETVVLTWTRGAVIVAALFDKSSHPPETQSCVAILECEREAAIALHEALGSALKSMETGGSDAG